MSGSNLTLSQQAREDLQDIWQYAAEVSEEKADKALDLIWEQCQMLASMPGMGRARDELRPGVRSWPVSSWVIFYRVTNSQVEIIRCLHGRRDMPEYF